MRYPTLLTIAVVSFGSAVPLAALAEHHAGQPPENFVQKQGDVQEHHRRGEMNDFGVAKKAPDKPFPWLALSMGVLALFVAAPFAYLVYRSTNKELAELKTVGRGNTLEGQAPEEGISRKPEKPDSLKAPPATSRDKVLEAVQSVSQWVPVDWVARTAGVSPQQATDDLTALADEGYLEHASDRGGKPIFRALTG